MNFEEKVQSMSGSEIILAMVSGLKKRHVAIDMSTLGFWDARSNICYGCAATNAICEISGKTFAGHNINTANFRAGFIGCSTDFIVDFELAIDNLRLGDIFGYNAWASSIGVAKMHRETQRLPMLEDDYTDEDLDAYIQFADFQKTAHGNV